MRPALTSVTLWLVVAVTAALGGAATVLATGTGSTPVLTPEQVAAALEKKDDTTGGLGGEPAPIGGTAQTYTTDAGTVTITCEGDRITGDTVTPASGWDVSDPAGHAGKREVVFTTDQPTASTDGQGGDRLVVTYACKAGDAAWESRAG